MSRPIVIFKEDGKISFSNENLLAKSPEPIVYSREETLAYIDYLRNKPYITIDSRVERYRTMFNRYNRSIGTIALRMIEKICSAKSAVDAYHRIAAEKAKYNSSWKLIPELGYIFSEDLGDYIVGLGFSEDEAKSVAAEIQFGNFKKSQWKDDPRLPVEFVAWAGNSKVPLESRSIIFNLTRFDYIEYKHRTQVTDQTKFTVTKCGLEGLHNAYKYMTKGIEGLGNDCFVIGYRDAEGVVPTEDLIELCEFLMQSTGMPEVILRNITEDEVTVIEECRKNTSEQIADEET